MVCCVVLDSQPERGGHLFSLLLYFFCCTSFFCVEIFVCFGLLRWIHTDKQSMELGFFFLVAPCCHPQSIQMGGRALRTRSSTFLLFKIPSNGIVANIRRLHGVWYWSPIDQTSLAWSPEQRPCGPYDIRCAQKALCLSGYYSEGGYDFLLSGCLWVGTFKAGSREARRQRHTYSSTANAGLVCPGSGSKADPHSRLRSREDSQQFREIVSAQPPWGLRPLALLLT